MKKLLCLSVILSSVIACTNLFADSSQGPDGGNGYPLDSTNILPPNVKTAAPARVGFVLASGQYLAYCRPGDSDNSNCDETVSNTQCPVGYSPQATVSAIWNHYTGAYALRDIVIQTAKTTPSGAFVPTNNGRGGYNLHLDYAYAGEVGFFAPYQAIGVDYTVDCMPN